VASWHADVPEGVDFAWCPEGCGRTTGDPYGGPCQACWAKVDDQRVDQFGRIAEFEAAILADELAAKRHEEG
jgi:hypothetical protein